jgi:hypothetical protein
MERRFGKLAFNKTTMRNLKTTLAFIYINLFNW